MFKRPVDIVVVHVTSLVAMVLGEFDVRGIISDRIDLTEEQFMVDPGRGFGPTPTFLSGPIR